MCEHGRVRLFATLWTVAHSPPSVASQAASCELCALSHAFNNHCVRLVMCESLQPYRL